MKQPRPFQLPKGLLMVEKDNANKKDVRKKKLSKKEKDSLCSVEDSAFMSDKQKA